MKRNKRFAVVGSVMLENWNAEMWKMRKEHPNNEKKIRECYKKLARFRRLRGKK